MGRLISKVPPKHVYVPRDKCLKTNSIRRLALTGYVRFIGWLVTLLGELKYPVVYREQVASGSCEFWVLGVSQTGLSGRTDK